MAPPCARIHPSEWRACARACVCVQLRKALDVCTPRMKGADVGAYRKRLANDAGAQSVLKSYTPQLEAWAHKVMGRRVEP